MILAAALSGLACAGSFAASTQFATTAPSAPASTLAVQSMRTEETPEAYKVTLSVPGAEATKVNASLEGQTLHISSGHTSGAPGYEQSLYLPAADSSQPLSVTHEKNELVISVLKAKGTPAASAPAAPVAAATPPPGSIVLDSADTSAPPTSARTSSPTRNQLGTFESQVRQQFARMQQQMDAMLGDSTDNSDPTDPLANFFGAGFANNQPAASAVTVEDKGADYVIRAQHVNDTTKIDVAVDDGNVLKITTRNRSSSKGGQAQSFQSSNATQVMTLPTAVQSDKMTTKREGDSMIITLPKA